jgi:dihydropteroate synthase
MSVKYTFLNSKSLLNTKGTLTELNKQIWGVLNLTPDSFFDGGQYNLLNKAIMQTEKMLEEGADVIDAGGASSRPGAELINEQEELKRVIPYVKEVKKLFPKITLSIDTFNSKVAEAALIEGADIINDISGGNIDPNIFEVVKKHQCPLVIMHMRGNPTNMQQQNNYHNLVNEVVYELSLQVSKAKKVGINDIIIDPGFGFSKNTEQNFMLLKNLEQFKILGYPLLVGLSRKSMIYKTLNITPEKSLNGTTILNTIALLKGADILRVHDVKEAKEIIYLVNQF